MWLFGFRRKEKNSTEHGKESELFSIAILSPAGIINKEWEEVEGLQFQLETVCSSPWAAGDLYKTLVGLWMPQLAGEGRRSVLT